MHIPLVKHVELKGSASAVFDIGGGSVAAAVIVAAPDVASRVLFNTRVTLSNEDRTEAQLSTALAKALSEAGTIVLDQYARSTYIKSHGPVKDAYVVAHAPWVHSMTRDSHITLASPTRITREAIAKAGADAVKEAGEVLKGYEVFERTVVRVELNGYPTALPVGKIASSIRTLSMESSIDQNFKSAITNALATLLPGRTPLFHSAMFAYSTVVRELSAHASSYTFLDIGSEASACSVIKSGAITQQGVIPAGVRTLIRSVKESGAQTSENIYSMIRMISEGVCSAAACEEVAKVLGDAEPSFMRSFGEVFSTMITDSHLPNTLIISVHPTIAPWAISFFERIDFSQFTLTGKPFVVQILSTRDLTDLSLFGKESGTVDTGIAVISALVHIRYT